MTRFTPARWERRCAAAAAYIRTIHGSDGREAATNENIFCVHACTYACMHARPLERTSSRIITHTYTLSDMCERSQHSPPHTGAGFGAPGADEIPRQEATGCADRIRGRRTTSASPICHKFYMGKVFDCLKVLGRQTKSRAHHVHPTTSTCSFAVSCTSSLVHLG